MVPPIAIVWRDADMQGFGSSDDLLRVVPGPDAILLRV